MSSTGTALPDQIVPRLRPAHAVPVTRTFSDYVTRLRAEVAAGGVFMAIGHEPNTKLFVGQLENNGHAPHPFEVWVNGADQPRSLGAVHPTYQTPSLATHVQGIIGIVLAVGLGLLFNGYSVSTLGGNFTQIGAANSGVGPLLARP